MKKYLFAFFATLLVAIVAQTPAFANWAFVQGNVYPPTYSNTSTISKAFTSSVTAGDLVVVTVSTYNGLPSGCTDSASNTYTLAATANNGSKAYCSVYYSQVTTGGTLTVSATLPGANYGSLAITEYSATAGTIYLVNTTTSNGTAPGSATAGNIYAPNTSLVVVGNSNGNSATATTAGSGFTVREHVTYGSGAEAVVQEDFLNAVPSNNPISCAMTFGSGTVNWSLVGAVFMSGGDGPIPGGTQFGGATAPTTAAVTYANTTNGGTGPYTIKCYLALAPGGVPGTFSNNGTATGGSPYTVTGLSANTEYAIYQQVTDSSTPTPLVSVGGTVFFTTPPYVDYVTDNFADTAGTQIVTSSTVPGHISPTCGNVYNILPSKSSSDNGIITPSGDAWATENTTGCWVVSNPTNLYHDDPISITYTQASSPSGGENVGILNRIQSNGSGYFCSMKIGTGQVFIYSISSSGTETELSSSSSSTTPLLGGTYTLTYAISGITHNVYLQNSSGQYLNGPSNTFQTAKVACVSAGDLTTQAAGQAGFYTTCLSNQAAPTSINSFNSGGGGAVIPTDLGCDMSTDRLNRLNVLLQEGGVGLGVSTFTYELQRSPHGANTFTNLAAMTPLIPYVDRAVSASTSYDYQVVVTDGAGNTTTSQICTATTIASITIATFTLQKGTQTALTSGSFPITTNNGQNVFMSQGDWWWDDQYQMYFVEGTNVTQGSQFAWTSYNLYGSLDLMNWTDLGVSFTNVIGGYTLETNINRPHILPHPTNGLYYLFITSDSTAFPTTQKTFVFTASNPLGPWTNVYVGEPTGVPNNDHGEYVDYNGVGYMYQANYAAAMTGNWTSFGSSQGNLATHGEDPAPFRYNRTMYIFGGGRPDPPYPLGSNDVMSAAYGSNPVGGSPGMTLYPGTNGVPNYSTFYTTAAELTPAPGGIAYGYDGSTISVGINPEWGYVFQPSNILTTLTGQKIILADRWPGGPLAGYPTTNCSGWFPISFSSVGGPMTVPWTASFVPSSGFSPQTTTAASGAATLSGM